MIRKSYKGGFTYLNPIYKEKDVENVNVLDVNSLYPSVMYYEELPIGEPLYFIGKYKEDIVYPLYIQRITCRFKLKENKIPTIQIKGRKSIFAENEYLISSDDEIVSLTLTNIDLKLFLDHYDTEDLTYEDGWKFRSFGGKGTKGLFNDYIEKWTERKIKAGKEGNKGQRQLAKLMLNSLYGKFAMSTELRSKLCYLGEDGIVHYTLSEKEQTDGIYVPIGSWITSYAREKTIRTSQKIKDYSIQKYGIDKYIYSDTDSIHTNLSIEELKTILDIDDFELGKWAHEGYAEKGKFVRQKCYLELIDNEIKITCAGLPKNCYSQVEWDKFKEGFTATGKLTFKHVKGGVKLVETDFTIKETKLKKHLDNF